MSIRKNTLINLAGAVIPMAVMLVTVPLYLKILGEVRYGVLALVWLIIGYFSFLEMGLGKSTANHIARLHDAKDDERSTVFWTALAANTTLGVAAAFILWAIGEYLFTSVLKMPDEFHQEMSAALPWLIATLPLALVSSVLNGALEGRNRFLAVNALQVTGNVVFQLVPLFAAYSCGPGLEIVVPAAVLSRALMNIPALMVCAAYVPLKGRPKITLRIGKSLFSYGGWVAISGVATPLLDTLDRFFIGVVIGAQAVTHYTIPMQLVGKVKVMPGSLSRALFPRFSAAEKKSAGDLAKKATSALIDLMTPIVMLGIIFLRPFMELWVGHAVTAVAAPIGEVLLIGMWVNSMAHIPYFYLQGRGRPDVVAKLHMAEIFPYIFLLLLATYYLGLYGAALIWNARVMVEAGLLFRFSGISLDTLYRLGSALIVVILTAIATHQFAEQGWGVLWRSCMAVVPVLFLAWRFKMSSASKTLLLKNHV